MIGSKKLQRASFNKLVIFFACFLWFVCFSKAVLPTHFLDEGLNLNQILLGTVLSFLSQLMIALLFPFFINKVSSRRSWLIAIAAFLIYILLIIKFKFTFQFYLASFISGFATTFFYSFYNIAHFKLTPKQHIGHSSAIMFNVGPIISVAAPLLAGLLADVSYYIVWILAAVFFLIPVFLAKRQYAFNINYDFKAAFNEIKATRNFIFIQGFWEALIFGIIPVYTLFFIQSPLGYGSYLAYLSVISVIANFFMGKLSDNLQRSALFLYPITLLMALLTFLFPLATKSITLWIIITGAVQFLMPLFWNFSTAIVVDSQTNIEHAMPVRELLLSSGRVTGLLLAFLSFSMEQTPFYIFFMLGSAMLLFPFHLFWRNQIAKSYSYL